MALRRQHSELVHETQKNLRHSILSIQPLKSKYHNQLVHYCTSHMTYICFGQREKVT